MLEAELATFVGHVNEFFGCAPKEVFLGIILLAVLRGPAGTVIKEARRD